MKNKTVIGADADFQNAFLNVYDGAKYAPTVRATVDEFRRLQFQMVKQYFDATLNKQTPKKNAYAAMAALIPAMTGHAYTDPRDTLRNIEDLTTSMILHADTPELQKIAREATLSILPELIRQDRRSAHTVLAALTNVDPDAPTPPAITKNFMAIATGNGDTAWLVKSVNGKKVGGNRIDAFSAYANGSLDDVLLANPGTPEAIKQVSEHAAVFTLVASGKITPTQAAAKISAKDGSKYMALEA